MVHLGFMRETYPLRRMYLRIHFSIILGMFLMNSGSGQLILLHHAALGIHLHYVWNFLIIYNFQISTRTFSTIKKMKEHLFWRVV